MRAYLKLRLDLCKICCGVWFDQIDLSEIWNEKLEEAAKTHLRSGGTGLELTGDGASFFTEVLGFDLGSAIYGSEIAVNAIGTIVETTGQVLSNAPEVAGAIVEGTGELAGSVFEAIAEILGSL